MTDRQSRSLSEQGFLIGAEMEMKPEARVWQAA